VGAASGGVEAEQQFALQKKSDFTYNMFKF